MAKDFFDKPFSSETMLKLEIFRQYIRKWIPVFLTRKKDGRQLSKYIKIYDFFAGKGKDNKGNLGSPLIIIDELKNYLQTHCEKWNSEVSIEIYFNDANKQYIDTLKSNVSNFKPPNCCDIFYSALDFYDAFNESIAGLKSNNAAKLLIMDQFGFKLVNKSIFNKIINFPRADFIFFVASSNIRRFIQESCVIDNIPVNMEQSREVEFYESHRFIYRQFKELIPESKEYYLAPFSILKGSNINGVIFGSPHIRGIEKFMNVAWKMDRINGEANYNIGNDPEHSGQLHILEEDQGIKKQEQFEKDLIKFLISSERNNNELFKFSLENGFTAKHTTDILKKLLRQNRIRVISENPDEIIRKNTFYIGYSYFKDKHPKLYVKLIGN